ncbi:LOW QUALITY PROTEIN: band 7 protein AGAP004871-like [Nylanderia fulva]|uniref:LOW QUALITY PROTEIN: band 7 protein AGAP004871-like n=1 Tax=Nylanderia fulva TaxID=613905 RepID=UPI0010FBB8BD|nr:LOW QUALITY PROTEIN: band 7 protein AGAP004871-like [Nylanderia fulva]
MLQRSNIDQERRSGEASGDSRATVRSMCCVLQLRCYTYRKDVRLPVQLQRAMAREAEAAREARTKVIAAEGEMRASHSLKEASDVISTSLVALQLRYLHILNNICGEENSTVIFSLPVEFLTPFFIPSLRGHQETVQMVEHLHKTEDKY